MLAAQRGGAVNRLPGQMQDIFGHVIKRPFVQPSDLAAIALQAGMTEAIPRLGMAAADAEADARSTSLGRIRKLSISSPPIASNHR